MHLQACKLPPWAIHLLNYFERLASRYADTTYTVSPSYSSILQGRGIEPLPITWGGYANAAVFHPGRRHEGNWRENLTFGHPHDFLLVTAGRVSPEKDINFLVKLVRFFRNRGLAVRLAIIGDGPARDDFIGLHGDPATGIWFVPGFLQQNELAAFYASADVVASASTFETFGYTALEAMACGTPFLGPNAQGFRDVVAHES